MPQTAHCDRRCQSFLFPRNFRRLCRSPLRRPPSRFFFLRRRILHFGLLFLLLSQTNCQFGEIASVISSLVASGAPAGLAGLGTAGSLGSLGASAGSGAASALSNIGPLYQLAQAALQLTGTGVGIANQASESAWFPVVVENAAKMHRDLQDRLVQGGLGGAVGGHETGTAKGAIKERSNGKNGAEFGTDYGKEFGSEEKGSFGRGAGGLGSVDASSANLFGSRVSLLPLLPGFGTTLATLLPEGTKRSLLPGKGSLLPGESPLGEFGKKENGGGEKLLGIGTVEEVPLSPPSTESEKKRVFGIDPSEAPFGRLLPGEVSPTKENNAKQINSSTAGGTEKGGHLAISSPKITVKLADYDEEKDRDKSEDTAGKKTEPPIDQIETEFNEDNAEERGRAETTDEEPLIPSEVHSLQRLRRLNMTQIELGDNERAEDEGENGEANAVPKLQKLISQLKRSNLSELDLEELQNQLAENEEPGEPRENTEPTTTAAAHSTEDATETANGAEAEQQRKKGKGPKRIRPPNPKREKASNRNLEAFRKGSERDTAEGDGGEGAVKAESSEGEVVELVDGQRDPILRKIVDFRHPPVILSLEKPQPNPADSLTPFKSEKRKSNRIEGGGTDSGETQKANDEQLQAQRSNEAIPTRALGVRSEKVGERAHGDGETERGQRATEEGTEEKRGERKKSNGRIGDGGTTQGPTKQQLDLKRPHDRQRNTSTETTDQTEQNNELPVVDSMVEKTEMEQQQPKEQQNENWQQNYRQRQPQNTQQQTNTQYPQHGQLQYLQQQNQQYSQLQNQLNYPQQQTQLQYIRQQNLQYQQQQNQQYPQHNQIQYLQQENKQYPPQQNKLQYPHHQNQPHYPQQPNHAHFPHQQNQQFYAQHQQYPQQLQYPIQHHQNSHINPSDSLNYLHNPHNEQETNKFHLQQQLNGPLSPPKPSRGRQFGQRQRAVGQPIDQQHNRQNNQKMANGREVKVPPKVAPPVFPPRRMPTAAGGAKNWGQPQAKGNGQRKFPPRTVPPPASVLSQQTTTPSEVQYPFSRGTLLTLAQPTQFHQRQTKHLARK